jgi:hypothetical protein
LSIAKLLSTPSVDKVGKIDRVFTEFYRGDDMLRCLQLKIVCEKTKQEAIVDSDTSTPTSCPICHKPKWSLVHPFGCKFSVTVLRGPQGGGGASNNV